MASVDAAPPVVTQAPAPEAENGASSNPNADNANSTGATKKPPLTKAERRELQEKQRAAKAAATVVKGSGPQGQGQGKSGPKQSKKEPPPNIATGGVSGSASGVSQAQPSARRANFKPGKEVDASGPSATTGAIALADLEAQRKHQTRIFSHFILPKKEGKIGAGIKGEVHPVIIRLGRQFADMKIVGANARCIAMLVAFKTVIQDYVLPPNQTLPRDLTQYLSPQISYLVSARPMGISMGNAIRELKYHISVISIDKPEQDAKDHLCEQIDTYISHRIILADSVIEDFAMPKIQNGAVIMTFARKGANISMDSRQAIFGESGRLATIAGRMLAQFLKVGIPCSYLLVNGIGSVIPEVSLVFLGAHAVNSNGSVYSRAGTALVAMLAKEHSVPVLVLAETYKYSNNLPLDSFTKNELAPPPDPIASFPKITPRENLVLAIDTDGHSSVPNLQVINPLYDLTPHTHISALVTEVGLIPPSAISTLAGLRDKDKGMQMDV